MKSQNVLHLPQAFAGDEPIETVVIGAGGTGSHLLDALAALHATLRQLGHAGFAVRVMDGDQVSVFNIGRQRFTAGDVGLQKATIMVHRLNAFYGTNWTAEPRNARADAEDLATCDLVITCVDKAQFRAQVGRYGARHNRHRETLWLDTGNDAAGGQCVMGHLCAAPEGTLRIPNVFDLYPELSKMQAVDADAPSCSTEDALRKQALPVNRAAALIAMEMLYNLIRQGRLEYHGVRFWLDPLRTAPMRIDPVEWAFYGYAPTHPQEPKTTSKPARRPGSRRVAA